MIDGHSYSLDAKADDKIIILDALREKSFSSPDEFQEALAQLPNLVDRKVSVVPSSFAVEVHQKNVNDFVVGILTKKTEDGGVRLNSQATKMKLRP